MKKILFGILCVVSLVSCSSGSIKKEEVVQKYGVTKEDVANWEGTMVSVLVKESLIADWYNEENPLMYLKKINKMTAKDYYFFKSLEEKKPEEITDGEQAQYIKILTDYVNALPRKFYLTKTNIKDPEGLVKFIIKESKSNLKNPTIYIKESISSAEDWAVIEEFSQKSELTSKEIESLVKIFNGYIKNDNLFNKEYWLNQEVSDRLLEIVKINSKEIKSDIEINNVNAKAFYIAYAEYLSKPSKWKK